MSDLQITFTAYLIQKGMTKTALAEHLDVSRKTMSEMWKRGIESWRWMEVIKAAQILGIPIDVLRESLTYRKDKS